MFYVEFKTKPFDCWDGDNKRRAINFKREVSRADTAMRPIDHAYFNSDLFPSMLQAAYAKGLDGRTWCFVDDAPVGVTVDTTKFLAVVRVPLMFDPRHAR